MGRPRSSTLPLPSAELPLLWLCPLLPEASLQCISVRWQGKDVQAVSLSCACSEVLTVRKAALEDPLEPCAGFSSPDDAGNHRGCVCALCTNTRPWRESQLEPWGQWELPAPSQPNSLISGQTKLPETHNEALGVPHIHLLSEGSNSFS